MKRAQRHSVIPLLASLLLLVVCATCANRGVGPQGGPKDETPPKMVKEEPLNGTVNYHEKRIEITFDEYLQLNDVANQVLISPPQQRPPDVRAVGKKVTVTFDEDLRDSTTYTIDFGSAICDNNEKNALEGYTFSFATGPEIDTLRIGGIVINAENLNPVANIYAGIHLNHADSAFETEPFTRIARTNDKGEFTIQNVHRGQYRLYALNDVSRDYLYQPGEGLAMYDSLLMPTVRHEGRSDTLFLPDTIVAALDSLQLDTLPHDTLGRYWERIEAKTVPVYEPDHLVLLFFTEDKQRHYFIRCLREEQHCFKLVFSAPQDSMPQITLFEPDDNWLEYAVQQPSPQMDTVFVWLTDSSVISRDTLVFGLSYLLSDSLYNLQPQTDTVYAVYRAPRISDKARELMNKKKAEEVQRLKLKHNGSASFEVYDSLRIYSPTPLRDVRFEGMHLQQRKDTLYKPIKASPFFADSAKMSIVVPFRWEPEKEYRLVIDSAAMTDVYGITNDELEIKFKVRSLEEYSTLIIKVEDYDPRMRIQLLSEKDAVVRELPAAEDATRFEYLKPTSYYMRLYLDLDGNGKWTTGDWLKQRQPEPVFYFSGKLTLRANWDFEETFDIHAKPLLEQKPEELKTSEGNKKK